MKVRANQIQGMIKNWSDVEEATQKAYESEGTAAKENEKYMNSMQGKINATKTSWQALANTFLSSDFLKGLIDSGQTFLDIINGIVKTTGALPPILAIIAGYLSATKNIGIFTTINRDLVSAATNTTKFSNQLGILGTSFADISATLATQGFSGLKNLFANTTTSLITETDKAMLENFNKVLAETGNKSLALGETMVGASKGARELAMSADSTGVNLEGVSVAADGATVSMVGAKIATVALQAAITFGITLAIQGLITLFQKLKDAIPTVENTSKRLKESATELSEVQDKLDGLNSELTTTKKRIDELLRKDHLSIVERAELNRLKAYNAELERQIALQNSQLKTTKGKVERDFVSSVNATLNQDNNVLGAGHVSNENMFALMMSQYLNPTNDAVKEVAKKWLDEFIPKFNDAVDTMSDFEYDSLSDDAKAAYDKVMDIQNTYLAQTENDFETVFNGIFNQARFSEGREALQEAAKGGLTSNEVENLYNNNSSVKAMIDNMQKVGLINEITADTFSELATQISVADQAVGTIAADEKVAFSDLMANEGVQETIDTYKDKLNDLTQALEDFRNGDLSDSDLLELYEKFPELASRSDDLDTALSDLIDTTQSEIGNQFEEWESNMPTQEDVDNLNGVKDTLNAIGDTANSVSKVTAEISKLTTSLDDLQSTYDDIKEVIDDYNENGYLTLDNLQSIMDLEPEYINLLIDENGQINLNNQAYKKYIETKAKSLLVEQLKSLYESILAMTEEEAQAYANAKAYDGETSSVKDLLTATTELYIVQAQQKDVANGNTVYMDALTRSFSTAANYAALVESYISSLSTDQNEFSVTTSETTSALEEQKSALEEEKDALEDYKDSLEEAKDALEDYKSELESDQSDIQDLIDLVVEYIEKVKEAEKDSLDSQITLLEDQKEKFDDIIAQKKESLELAKEEREEAEKIADYQNAVAKDTLALAVADLDDSSAGKKAQKEAKDNLASSRKDLVDYLNEQDYNARVSELEAEQEAYDDYVDKQIDKLEEKKDAIDDYLDDTRQLYEDACDLIYNDTGSLYNDLWNVYVYPYTTKTKAEFDNLWSNAQIAINKYRGDNETLMGVMESLQSKIYDTESQISDLDLQIDNCSDSISELDDAISSTSDAINDTSSSISNVSSSISGLGDSVSYYAKQLENLKRVASETSTTQTTTDNNSGSTTFWVKYHGKKYTTTTKYNGDTSENRRKAAYELAQQFTGTGPVSYTVLENFRRLLGVADNSSPSRTNSKWYYDSEIGKFSSNKSNKNDAVKDILSQMKNNNRYWTINPIGLEARISSGLKHYSSGTRHSLSEFISQEKGLEALFVKNPNSSGSYTLTTPDSQVFDHKRTDNLYDFSGDPEEFISKLADNGLGLLSSDELSALGWDSSLITSQVFDKMFNSSDFVKNLTGISGTTYNNDNSANNQNINFNMPIYIQGNADQYAAKAINDAADKIQSNIFKELTRMGGWNRRLK